MLRLLIVTLDANDRVTPPHCADATRWARHHAENGGLDSLHGPPSSVYGGVGAGKPPSLTLVEKLKKRESLADSRKLLFLQSRQQKERFPTNPQGLKASRSVDSFFPKIGSLLEDTILADPDLFTMTLELPVKPLRGCGVKKSDVQSLQRNSMRNHTHISATLNFMVTHLYSP